MSSSDPAASESDKKPPEKEKPGDVKQTTNPDQHETPAKEARQKGEKRKAEPGKVSVTTSKEKYYQFVNHIF